jgi:hypothetical protein
MYMYVAPFKFQLNPFKLPRGRGGWEADIHVLCIIDLTMLPCVVL